jgi:hypothetical protein
MKQQTIYNQLKQLATATMCERWRGVKGGKCFTCCAYKEARDRETFNIDKSYIVKFWVGFKASLEYSKLSHHDKLSALAMFLADKSKERKSLSKLGATRLSRSEARSVLNRNQITNTLGNHANQPTI